jgi:hypothetical protein
MEKKKVEIFKIAKAMTHKTHLFWNEKEGILLPQSRKKPKILEENNNHLKSLEQSYRKYSQRNYIFGSGQ